ncbi:MAG: class II aldolase/adducin family protein [Phycisphaerales bacterium]|nr:class II aldolase/adducin family protein [Phycisphaerales bacterium]
MSQTELTLRNELCRVAERVHAAGLVSGSDGNVSTRLADDRFLVSASGTCLGTLTPDELVVIDANGDVVEGDRRASSERWMHLAAYGQRPDIRAIIHAHPPTVVAMTLVGLSMPSDVLPETIIAFGSAPTSAYATPGTRDGGDIVRDLARNNDAIILDRHGSLTMGDTIHAAMMKLEQLEHAARIITLARQLGELRTLSPDEIGRLIDLRKAYHGGDSQSRAN